MSEKITITFLGTSDAVPTATRNHTAILLNYNGETILIDCGEGTQRQFRKAKLNPCKLTRLLISHWHGDHVLGIPGLLQTLVLNGYNKTLYIYGPKGTKSFMKKILDIFIFRGKYSFNVKEVAQSKRFFENKDFYLEAKAMTHGIPCNAYVFVKKGQIKIDKKRLEKTNLPSNSLIQKLKQGENITYNGKKYLAKNLTFKEKDKKIAFIFDTSLNKAIVPFIKNSDLLICEATFSSELEEKAKDFKHLTAKQAAQIAKRAGVKKLILTHLSQRYDKEKRKILNEARKIFKNSFLVEDLEIIELS